MIFSLTEILKGHIGQGILLPYHTLKKWLWITVDFFKKLEITLTYTSSLTTFSMNTNTQYNSQKFNQNYYFSNKKSLLCNIMML